jgi:ribosomal protein S6--L-glutamate ligase
MNQELYLIRNAPTIQVCVIHYAAERAENWALLTAASRARRVELLTWEPHSIDVRCTDSAVTSFVDGREAHPDVVLHRTVAPFRGIVVPACACWAAEGATILNDLESAYRCRDKLLTTVALQRAGVPIVPTLAFDEPREPGLRTLTEGAVVVKPAHGVRGDGVEAFVSAESLVRNWNMQGRRLERPSLDKHYVVREHYLAQPLVAGGGQDLRAFVVGGRCIALISRRARPGEIRANLALGATASQLPLTHPAARVAVSALSACGLDYGGVDLIEDEEGTIRVLEVDAWAGFAGISRATGVDIAGAILELAVSRARQGSAS